MIDIGSADDSETEEDDDYDDTDVGRRVEGSGMATNTTSDTKILCARKSMIFNP
jgi:hypothetical protein